MTIIYYYYNTYLTILLPFPVKKLNTLGKYGQLLMPKVSDHMHYSANLKALQPFSSKQLDALGRNAFVLFQNVKNHERDWFIKNNLTNLTPEEIKKFAQEKEKEISENK